MVFQCINIRQVPWEMLKTAAFSLGFQHLPRDLANVNALKTMFDPYNDKMNVTHETTDAKEEELQQTFTDFNTFYTVNSNQWIAIPQTKLEIILLLMQSFGLLQNICIGYYQQHGPNARALPESISLAPVYNGFSFIKEAVLFLYML